MLVLLLFGQMGFDTYEMNESTHTHTHREIERKKNENTVAIGVDNMAIEMSFTAAYDICAANSLKFILILCMASTICVQCL